MSKKCVIKRVIFTRNTYHLLNSEKRVNTERMYNEKSFKRKIIMYNNASIR